MNVRPPFLSYAPHPTPLEIRIAIEDALHDAHARGEEIPAHVFGIVRRAITDACDHQSTRNDR